MSQYLLSRCKNRDLPAKNTLKFILNINFESKFVHSTVKDIDLRQINRKNMQYVTLSGPDAYKIPIIGLGTWRAIKDDVYNAVLAALDVGYRHIDTAFNYNNEEQIGKAINKWISQDKGSREHLFVTTKLPNFGNRARDVEKFLKKSLARLDLQYIDLYLIHMPFALQLNDEGEGPLLAQDGTGLIDFNNDNVATWKAMEQQVKKGLVKSIGLSNFNAEQVRRIYDCAEIKPVVLQVELHAHMQQTELIKSCKRMNIAVTGYAPLGSPAAAGHFKEKYNFDMKTPESLLTNSAVEAIAKKYHKTTGQILLKHLTQKNIIVIPKSSNSKRIEDNFKIFDFNLDWEDMLKLNSLDKKEEGRIFDFLFFKGIEQHPEYPFK